MKWLSLRILPGLVIAGLLIGSCATPLPAVPVILIAPSSTPEPSATPNSSATPVASATSVAPVSDDVWDRIVSNNKIVVGTSWDYPPFASIDANYQVVGFDIAIIQEVGRRLKVPVDIQNFTFEGLPDALQINQIDVAIAAISISPERSSRMSFSPVYYVNQTAVLARNDSQVSITDFKQLANYRVGVQRGTTYETMVKTQLVDTGLMSAAKLLSYAQYDEAVRDLVANRVDLVVIGQATANFYMGQMGLKIVGSDFSQQDLAIAMRTGTPRLKAEIDRVMGDMLTDGTILGYIQEYNQNNVAKAFPTQYPASQATSTPVPLVATVAPTTCVNGMKFVADLSYADNDMQTPPFIKSGTTFNKVWRIENSGTCTWTPSYRLVYAYGNLASAQMNGQPVNMPVNVAPGQAIDLSVKLTAPPQLLTYQGFWQMENATGRRFGQTIWVGITTLSDLETPVLTARPPSGNYCQITLTSPKTSITVSGAFDAIWTVKNISKSDWSMESVDYKFISGTKMHEKAVYNFSETIKAGESGKIIVDMVAPTKPGIYNAKWAIVSGSKTICFLTTSVTVIAK